MTERRLLRSAKRRALLWLSAGGRCAHHLRSFKLDPAEEKAPVAQDTGAQADAIRIEINDIGDDATKALHEFRGRPWGMWGEIRKEVFGHAYRIASWPRGTKLDGLDDLALLLAVRDAMQHVQARILDGGL